MKKYRILSPLSIIFINNRQNLESVIVFIF